MLHTLRFSLQNAVYFIMLPFFYSCKKGKAIPLQAWTGPEGPRRMRLPDFKTIGTWSW